MGAMGLTVLFLITEAAREAKSGPGEPWPQHDTGEDVAGFPVADGVQEGVFPKATEPGLHRPGHSGRRRRPAGVMNTGCTYRPHPPLKDSRLALQLLWHKVWFIQEFRGLTVKGGKKGLGIKLRAFQPAHSLRRKNELFCIWKVIGRSA